MMNKRAIKERLRSLRALVAEINLHLEDDQLFDAYTAAERAQDTAFDVKHDIGKLIEEAKSGSRSD